MNIPKHYLIIASIAIVAGGYAFYRWSCKKNGKPPYVAIQPERRNMSEIVDASGRLSAKDEIIVGSLLTARVVKLLADDNDVVKKDQVLVELDDGRRIAAVQEAEAQLGDARVAAAYQERLFARQKKLFEQKFISQETFDGSIRAVEGARWLVKQREAELTLSQQNYDNLFVKSPDDGVVIARKVDLGQMVASALNATEMFVIAKDLHKMEVRINVDEADVGKVHEGQEASFVVDAFPKQLFKSAINKVKYKSKVDGTVVSYEAIMDVENPDLVLRPGMTTNVDITVASSEHTLAVPNKVFRLNSDAIKKVAEGLKFTVTQLEKQKSRLKIDLLWVVEGKTFKQVEVQTGMIADGFVEIISGVDEKSAILAEVPQLARAPNPVVQRLVGGRG